MVFNQIKRPDITVTLRCNNRCTFCPRTILSHIAVKTTEGLHERLEMVRRGGDRVVLTGGEVTILDEFFDIITVCREMGFREIAVISNGRRFSDEKFARRAVESGISEICITVYDLRRRVHDGLTRRKGSLKETMTGIENILDITGTTPKPILRINTILSIENADGMVDLVRHMALRKIPSILIAEAVLSRYFSEPLPYGEVRKIVEAIVRTRAGGDSSLVFRGFPLCIFKGLESVSMEGRDAPGSVRVEAQNIDTTFTPEDETEKYFAEFYSSFERVESCSRCGAAGICPGVQELYLSKFGSGEFVPIAAGTVSFGPAVSAEIPPPAAFEITEQDIDEQIEEREDPFRIAVTPTTACQLRCTYCMVKLGRRISPPEVLDRSVDLLMTSASRRPEIQFFGGEPLLRFDEVKRTMKRTARLYRGRDVLFTITTNGILLDEEVLRFLKDYNVRILFSMDGDFETQKMCRFRGRKNARKLQKVMEQNLEELMRSSVPYFVNMVFAPETVHLLEHNFHYLVGKGVELLQVCYANAIAWDARAMAAALAALRAVAEGSLRPGRSARRFRLQNLGSYVEPAILSNDLLVDVDGTLYGDAALFCEKALPGLRKAYRVGHIDELDCFDGLRKSRRENLRLLRGIYPEGSDTRKMIEKQLGFGILMDRMLREVKDGRTRQEGRRPPREPPSLETPAPRPYADSNPLLEKVLKRGLKTQLEFIGKHPGIMKLPVLLIENECCHDCIFCKSKPVSPTPLERIEGWLEENRGSDVRKLGLIGNEPLAHPRILEILAFARRQGFREFEVLSSGQPLADGRFVRELAEGGVRVFSIPLYSPGARRHDLITQTEGSHAGALEGIRNVERAGGNIFVHANLLRQNISDMESLEKLVVNDLHLPFCIIPVRPKMANLPYGELAPSYDEMIRFLAGKVETLVGFPLCVIEQIQPSVLVSSSVISDLLKLYLLDQRYCKPPRLCGECAKRKNCTGTYHEHIRIYGEESLGG